MKANVTKTDLMESITRAKGALPARSTSIHALQNMLLQFREDDGAIRCLATDLEVSVVSDCPATIQEGGVLGVPGDKLFDSIRNLPDGEITLMTSDRNVLTLKSGKSRLNLRGIPQEEYPHLPDIAGDRSFEVDALALGEAIRRTIVASANDTQRSFLTGAYLNVSGKKGRMVATDGHRLAVTDFSVNYGDKAEIGVIVPVRVLGLVGAGLPSEGNVKVSVSDSHVIFESRRATFTSRLIAEKFPDYQKIIPKSSDRRLVVNRNDLIDVLGRVVIFTNPRTSSTLLQIKQDRLVISAETPEFGDAHDEVEASVEGSTMEINFNGRYLLDVAKVLTGDELIIELGEKIKPAVFKTKEDKGYTYILMPLRG